MYKVYKHTTPSGKVYIGITGTSVQRRWDNGRGYRHNPHFWNAIQKYGWESIRHEVLEDGLTLEEACERERELIAKYRSFETAFGYNQDLGGIASGRASETTKAKLSASTTEQFKNPERRKKQQEALHDYFMNPEARKKTSEAIKRYFEKEGSREKTGAAARKYYAEHPEARELNRQRRLDYYKNNPDAKKILEKPILQYSTDGELIAEWESATVAAEKLNFHKSCICRVCQGKLNTHKGYVWKYKYNEHKAVEE